MAHLGTQAPAPAPGSGGCQSSHQGKRIRKETLKKTPVEVSGNLSPSESENNSDNN